MSSISSRIIDINHSLPKYVKLVAVSKYHPIDALREAYTAGQRIFAESRAQELAEKAQLMPSDTIWHYIGNIQTNKLKYIVPYVHMIESVTSLKTLEAIDTATAKIGRTIDCLLEIHVAQEETKSGLTMNECTELLQHGEWKKLSHIRLCGVMCMASNTSDNAIIATEFRSVHRYFEEIKTAFFADAPYFNICSMGMSSDYPIAIEQGATHVRIGSAIFGERTY